MVNFEAIKSEKGLRTLIKRNLNKEIHPGTKPSIDFIYKILEDAYASDLSYDVTDMRNAVLAFAANSTHQAEYCIKLVNKMQFKSADPSTAGRNEEAKLVFYDIEVFPNLFLVNWKSCMRDSWVIQTSNSIISRKRLSAEVLIASLEKPTMFPIRMCMTLHLPEIKRA